MKSAVKVLSFGEDLGEAKKSCPMFVGQLLY